MGWRVRLTVGGVSIASPRAGPKDLQKPGAGSGVISSQVNTEFSLSLPSCSTGYWSYKVLQDVNLFRFLSEINLPNTGLNKLKQSLDLLKDQIGISILQERQICIRFQLYCTMISFFSLIIHLLSSKGKR